MFHFDAPYLTRIDAKTGAKKEFNIAKTLGTGIAYADPGPAKHGIVDTWWVAAGGGSLWLTNPNYDEATRVDSATAKVVAYVRLQEQIPFGVVVRNGIAWAAGAGKVMRIDPTTNRVTATLTLSKTSMPIFMQVSAGDSGLWATDYDAGMLYHLRVP